MLDFLVHLIVTSMLLLVVAKVVRGVEVDSWGSALIGALVLGLANAVVKPILVVLTLPITIVTLGLFLLVVNALVLQLVAWLAPGVRVRGFGPAFVGAIVLGLLNLGVSMLLG